MEIQHIDLTEIIAGFVIPLLTAFFSKCSWPAWKKGGLCFLIAVLASVIENLSNFTLANWIQSLFVIATTAQVTYSMLTKALAEQLQTVGPVKDEQPLTPAQQTELDRG
jgi:hypothetical protein